MEFLTSIHTLLSAYENLFMDDSSHNILSQVSLIPNEQTPKSTEFPLIKRRSSERFSLAASAFGKSRPSSNENASMDTINNEYINLQKRKRSSSETAHSASDDHVKYQKVISNHLSARLARRLQLDESFVNSMETDDDIVTSISYRVLYESPNSLNKESVFKNELSNENCLNIRERESFLTSLSEMYNVPRNELVEEWNKKIIELRHNISVLASGISDSYQDLHELNRVILETAQWLSNGNLAFLRKLDSEWDFNFDSIEKSSKFISIIDDMHNFVSRETLADQDFSHLQSMILEKQRIYGNHLKSNGREWIDSGFPVELSLLYQVQIKLCRILTTMVCLVEGSLEYFEQNSLPCHTSDSVLKLFQFIKESKECFGFPFQSSFKFDFMQRLFSLAGSHLQKILYTIEKTKTPEPKFIQLVSNSIKIVDYLFKISCCQESNQPANFSPHNESEFRIDDRFSYSLLEFGLLLLDNISRKGGQGNSESSFATGTITILCGFGIQYLNSCFQLASSLGLGDQQLVDRLNVSLIQL